MRRFLMGCALFGAMAYLVSDSNAQRPGGFGGGGQGGVTLLANNGVQEELKMTDEQKGKLKDMMDGLNGKRKENFAKLKDLPKDEIGAAFAKMMKEFNDSAMKEIKDKEILKADQLKRFKQIQLQQNVVATLTTDEEAIKTLSITDGQKSKLKVIQEELDKERRDLREAKTDRKEMGEKMAALTKEANEKATKVLGADQASKWKELVGAPYTVKFDGGGNRKKKPKDD